MSNDRCSYGRNFEGIPVNAEGYVYPANSGFGPARRYTDEIPAALGANAYREEIDAGVIAGIQIGVEDQLDPDRFWAHRPIADKETGEVRRTTKEDYLELASKIPAVCDALEKGRSLEELCADPELGATAIQYFSETNVLRVKADGNGYFELTGNGRHRALAARELNMKIPAKVIAQYRGQKQELEYGNDNSMDSDFGVSW